MVLDLHLCDNDHTKKQTTYLPSKTTVALFSLKKTLVIVIMVNTSLLDVKSVFSALGRPFPNQKNVCDQFSSITHKLISNGNRNEWSPIWSVIIQVIKKKKSDNRAAGV